MVCCDPTWLSGFGIYMKISISMEVLANHRTKRVAKANARIPPTNIFLSPLVSAPAPFLLAIA